eukprot:NODE_15_length_42055_cov_0.634117.p21 type:complete len:123 gc:universal NODE_15_length_42055_cov_0.634117:6696-7064(+)
MTSAIIAAQDVKYRQVIKCVDHRLELVILQIIVMANRRHVQRLINMKLTGYLVKVELIRILTVLVVSAPTEICNACCIRLQACLKQLKTGIQLQVAVVCLRANVTYGVIAASYHVESSVVTF